MRIGEESRRDHRGGAQLVPVENNTRVEEDMTEDPRNAREQRERMGFERPMNVVWLALLFVATGALWSWRAAVVLLVLLIAATTIGMLVRRGKT